MCAWLVGRRVASVGFCLSSVCSCQQVSFVSGETLVSKDRLDYCWHTILFGSAFVRPRGRLVRFCRASAQVRVSTVQLRHRVWT